MTAASELADRVEQADGPDDVADLVERRWKFGDLVQKKRNSSWRGVVVGFYLTEETLEGYNVKSLFEHGSCQLWPLAALDDWDGEGTPEQLEARIQMLAKREADSQRRHDDRMAALQARCDALCAAIDHLPVEDMVHQARDGSPTLLGYCMQAQGEWDDVMRARQALKEAKL